MFGITGIALKCFQTYLQTVCEQYDCPVAIGNQLWGQAINF